jgi:serine protease Do
MNMSRSIGWLGVSAAMVIAAPMPGFAMSGEAVNDVAREVTVLISGSDGSHGSGVIVAKNDSTYYVLTANHVVDVQVEYKLIAADKKVYQLDYSKKKTLPGVDLAVIEFSSEQNYKIAKLANSDDVKEGRSVFVSGWPKPGLIGNATGGTTRQFTNGQVSGFLAQPYNGYQMVYTNVTRAGMSGGPVLDAGGRVVGIHGLGESEDAKKLVQEGMSQESATIASMIKPGFNYAIPINKFLKAAPQAGLYLSLQVDNSSVSESSAPYVASAQVDKRDEISNLDKTLNTVGKAVNVIRGVRGIFSF